MNISPLAPPRGLKIDVAKLYAASRNSPIPVKPDDEQPEPEPALTPRNEGLSRLAEPGYAPKPTTSACTVEIRDGEAVAEGGVADSSAHSAAGGPGGLADVLSVLCAESDAESDQCELSQNDSQDRVGLVSRSPHPDQADNVAQRLPVTPESGREDALFEEEDSSPIRTRGTLFRAQNSCRSRKCRVLPRNIPDVPKSYQVNVVKPDRQVHFAETIRLHAGAKRPRLRATHHEPKRGNAIAHNDCSPMARGPTHAEVDDHAALDRFSLDSPVSFETVSLDSSRSSSSSTLVSSASDSGSSLSDISLDLPTNLVDYAPSSATSLGYAPRVVQIKQRGGQAYQPPRARPTSFFINSDSEDDSSSSSSSSSEEDEEAEEERRALMASQRTNRYISRKVALGTAEQLQHWAQQTAAAQAAATQADAIGTRTDAIKPKPHERSRASDIYEDMQRSQPASGPSPVEQVGDRLYTYGPWPPAPEDTYEPGTASALIRPFSAIFELAFCAIPLPFVPRLPALLDVFALARAMAPQPAPSTSASSRNSVSKVRKTRSNRGTSASSQGMCSSAAASSSRNVTSGPSRRSSTASSKRSSNSSTASSVGSAPSQWIVTPPLPPTQAVPPVPQIIVTDYDRDVEDALLRSIVRQRLIAQGGKVTSLRSFAQDLHEMRESGRLERSRARLCNSAEYQGFNDIRTLKVPVARRRVTPANTAGVV